MSLDPRQDLRLKDGQQRCLGRVSIVRIEGDRVFGTFVAEPDFQLVASIFRDFEEAVNNQLFREVDRLACDIEALDLRLTSADGNDSLDIGDVQIMNGTDLTCRVPNLGLTQSPRAAAHAG